MWIKILKDQIAPCGPLQIGQTHSLPAKIVAGLESDSYVLIDVDEKAIEKLGVEDRIRQLRNELVIIEASIKQAEQRLVELCGQRKKIMARLDQAQAKDDSDEQKKSPDPAAAESDTKRRRKGR